MSASPVPSVGDGNGFCAALMTCGVIQGLITPILVILSTARLAQSDRASDSYGGRVVALRQQSEGCEFDPRGGLVHDLFAVSASFRWGIHLGWYHETSSEGYDASMSQNAGEPHS